LAADSREIDLVPIYKSTPLTVDGRLDESTWQAAVKLPIHFILGKKGVAGEEAVGYVKICWDDYYLYIGYETYDRNLVAAGTGKTEGDEWNKRPGAKIWDAKDQTIDVAEFFVSFNDDPEHFWEIHHNAANQFSDVFVVSPRKESPYHKSLRWGIRFVHEAYIHDDGPYKLATAVRLKPRDNPEDRRPVPSSINDPSDVDTGYTAEIRLPFGPIGAPLALCDPDTAKWKLAGTTIRMQHVIQDADRKHRYHHSSKSFAGGWFHKGFEDWVRLRFVEEAGAPVREEP